MSQISLDEYQLITRETSGCDELPILALGLLGETIELLDSLTSTDSGKIIKEAGDIIWYSARIADVFEVKFSDIITADTIGGGKHHHNFALPLSATIVSEHVKKVFGHGHPLDKTLVCNALRAVIHEAMSMLHHREINVGLEEVMRQNVKKLRKRYPNGFSVERSMYRNQNED